VKQSMVAETEVSPPLVYANNQLIDRFERKIQIP